MSNLRLFYYSPEKFVHIIQDIAQQRGHNIKLNHLTTKEDAQNAPTPFTTYSFFYNGKLITNEILGEKKFLNLRPNMACRK